LLLIYLVACSAPPLSLCDDCYRDHPLGLHPAPKVTARRSAAGRTTWDTRDVFLLRNEGNRSFHYLLESTEPWLEFRAAPTGTLAPGASMWIELGIAAEAAPTTTGQHLGGLLILNAITFVQMRRIEVTCIVETQLSQAPPPHGTVPQVSEPRQVFVSSSQGSDRFDGLTADSPKKTLAAAIALLRNGHADTLRLKRGDVFAEGLGNWTKSGRSATEPMAVTGYGSAPERPRLLTGTDSGVTVHGAGAGVSNVAFVGIDFVAQNHDGANGTPYGVSLLAPCQQIRFEDCRFARYFVNVRIQGDHRDLAPASARAAARGRDRIERARRARPSGSTTRMGASPRRRGRARVTRGSQRGRE
jgi:hypothetical protein